METSKRTLALKALRKQTIDSPCFVIQRDNQPIKQTKTYSPRKIEELVNPKTNLVNKNTGRATIHPSIIHNVPCMKTSGTWKYNSYPIRTSTTTPGENHFSANKSPRWSKGDQLRFGRYSGKSSSCRLRVTSGGVDSLHLPDVHSSNSSPRCNKSQNSFVKTPNFLSWINNEHGVALNQQKDNIKSIKRTKSAVICLGCKDTVQKELERIRCITAFVDKIVKDDAASNEGIESNANDIQHNDADISEGELIKNSESAV